MTHFNAPYLYAMRHRLCWWISRLNTDGCTQVHCLSNAVVCLYIEYTRRSADWTQCSNFDWIHWDVRCIDAIERLTLWCTWASVVWPPDALKRLLSDPLEHWSICFLTLLCNGASVIWYSDALERLLSDPLMHCSVCLLYDPLMYWSVCCMSLLCNGASEFFWGVLFLNEF